MRGFTLLELLIVLTIISLTLTLLTPALMDTTPTQVQATARQIAAGARRARSQAITTNHPTALRFELAQRRFIVPGMSRHQRLADGVHIKLRTATLLVSNDGHASISFFPNGSSSGGNVHLSSGNHEASVEIDWFTGRVRIRDPRAGQ